MFASSMYCSPSRHADLNLKPGKDIKTSSQNITQYNTMQKLLSISLAE